LPGYGSKLASEAAQHASSEEVAEGASVGVKRPRRFAGKRLQIGGRQRVKGLRHGQNLSGTSFWADLGGQAMIGAERKSQQDGMRLW